MTNQYDPKDVMQYAGKKFSTANNSRYEFDDEGTFIGITNFRENNELKRRNCFVESGIESIAGISMDHYDAAKEYILTNDLNKLNKLIQNEGQEMKEGLSLVLSLEHYEAELLDIVGYITPKIEEIK